MTKLERFVWFVGEVHRALAMTVVSVAMAAGIVIVCLKAEDAVDGAAALGAAGIVLGGMYGFRTLENNKAKSVEGEVAMAEGAR